MRLARLAVLAACASAPQGCIVGSAMFLGDAVEYSRSDVAPVQVAALEVGALFAAPEEEGAVECGYIASQARRGESYLHTSYVGYRWRSHEVLSLAAGLAYDHLRLATKDGTESGSDGSLGVYMSVDLLWSYEGADWHGSGTIFESGSTIGLRYVISSGPEVLGGEQDTGRLMFTVRLLMM